MDILFSILSKPVLYNTPEMMDILFSILSKPVLYNTPDMMDILFSIVSKPVLYNTPDMMMDIRYNLILLICNVLNRDENFRYRDQCLISLILSFS